MTEFEYSLDLGVCGIRKARVKAKCESAVTGQILVELCSVELPVRVYGALDLLEYVSERTLEALKDAAFSAYLRERVPSKRAEGSVEEGVPA